MRSKGKDVVVGIRPIYWTKVKLVFKSAVGAGVVEKGRVVDAESKNCCAGFAGNVRFLKAVYGL